MGERCHSSGGPAAAGAEKRPAGRRRSQRPFSSACGEAGRNARNVTPPAAPDPSRWPTPEHLSIRRFPMRQRLVSTVAFLALGVVLVSARPARAAASCPIELGAIEDAKPNKLYLYFPAAADATYPEFGGAVDPTSPATAFNVADLASHTGTAADLQNAIRDVVIDDYCEFNVKILTTTTTPPTTFARRSTVAIGTDSIFFGTAGPNCGAGPAVPPCLAGTPPCYLFGTTQAFANPGFARVWAGTYQTMLGGAGGQLNGANSTLERWAFAIGGTAAHEGGHTYGLIHA